MGWGEAVRQVQILRADPSSMLAAAVEGWDYPLGRVEAILMNLYDLTFKATGAKNPTPYPRPFATDKAKTRRGNATGRSPEEIKAILRGQFGQPEAPV